MYDILHILQRYMQKLCAEQALDEEIVVSCQNTSYNPSKIQKEYREAINWGIDNQRESDKKKQSTKTKTTGNILQIRVSPGAPEGWVGPAPMTLKCFYFKSTCLPLIL